MVARCEVRTHALLRGSELKSDALDHSANLAHCNQTKDLLRTKSRANAPLFFPVASPFWFGTLTHFFPCMLLAAVHCLTAYH